ncbi:DUF5313 family protein [Jatrophihabitans sp.]|uniref:DUF5313 family protein n=1 Tax=Jatrophihabitans sp. TaxID=1932789 RepID=UPI0030C6DE1B|nr:hypothetical protein [Jatrophihabitans sp.]
MSNRPTVLQWLRYVFTGRVPAHLREWVLLDTTGRTWLLRHIARFLLQLSPVAVAVLLLLPAPIGIRIGCVFAGIAASVCFSFGYVVEMAEHRLENAGYPRGLAEVTRERRAQDAQRSSAARRRERAAARLARR